MFENLDEVEKRYEELTKKISDPEEIAKQNEWRKNMKEHADLEPVVLKYREYKQVKQSLEEAKEMLSDPELKDLAEEEMLKSKELLPTTGYVHGGCSPIGMKKAFPVTIDSSAENFATIIYSGGKIGYQVETSVEDLSKIVNIQLADITE